MYPVFVFLWRIVDVSVTIFRFVRISMGGVHTSVSSRDLGESFDEDEWYTTQCQENWVYHHMDEAGEQGRTSTIMNKHIAAWIYVSIYKYTSYI